MLKSLKNKLIAFVVVLLIISAILGTGYFFAEYKSHPVYLSKVDRLMYEKENKSPKYIITLPDKQAIAAKPQVVAKVEEEKKPINSNDDFVNQLMKDAPMLENLPDILQFAPLKHISYDSELIEETNGSNLPRISSDNRFPWSEYAMAPQTIQPNFHQVSIVIKNLGLDRKTTSLVINKFPPEVSLSFSPYGEENKRLITLARARGHETYVDLYLSPKDFLKSDAGPLSMSMTASQKDNLLRLNQTISSDSPIGGVIVNQGVADENNNARLTELFSSVKDMGLLLIDATDEGGVDAVKVANLPRQKADIVINDNYTKENISEQLAQAELIARSKGHVLVAIEPKPIVLVEVAKWIKTFSPQYSYEEMKEKNITEIPSPFALTPLSVAVVQ